jgi:hypothetical protein
MEDRNARLGALGGIVAVIALLVGFGLAVSGAPSFSESGQAWAGFISDHATRIQLGVTIVGVGIFFFIWFLGSLRSAIAAAEGDQGRLASIAFGGGLIASAILMVTLTGIAAAALRPEEIDPNITRALNDFGAMTAGPAAGALTALFAATAIAGYRHRFVAPWVAGFSALAAITQPLAFGVVFCTTGAFAADGVLGFVVPVLTFAVAILTLSWALSRPRTARVQHSTS